MSNRIYLTNQEDAWYDPDTCEKYQEDVYWNGNNHISRATGSQWEHEALYHTTGGSWVLHSWSQYQGSGPGNHECISKEDAYRWLAFHGHMESLPESGRDLIANMEI